MRCAFSLTSSRPSDVDAQLRQLVDLVEQRLRVDDDAVADDAGDARMQDAGRDQVQDELLPVDVDGVPRVVAALIARDDVESAASAGRRSCPCLRRPTGRPARDVHGLRSHSVTTHPLGQRSRAGAERTILAEAR